MDNYSLFEKNSYELKTAAFLLGEKQFELKTSVNTAKLVGVIKTLVTEKIQDIIPVKSERAVCFRVVMENNTMLFAKVFYSRRNEIGKLSLAQKAYAACGTEFEEKNCKIKKNVFLTVCPWIEGQPLIKTAFTMSEEEKLHAGADIAKQLLALHSAGDCGLSVNKARYDIIQARAAMLFGGCENCDLLYGFVKAHKGLLDVAGVPCHRDVHVNNIMCDPPSGSYRLIDFGEAAMSNPYRDFTMLMFYPKEFHGFVKSLINTYFSGSIPTDFWAVNGASMALYALRLQKQEYINIALDTIKSPGYIPRWWDGE